jgi:NADH-quinone oxidoreductase subunit M
MPLFTGLMMVIMLGSVGLPGLSGFIGEFLCLLGAYDAGRGFRDIAYLKYPQAFTTAATTGVILGAVYLLYMFQKVFFGPLTNPKNKTLRDLTGREIAVFVPIVVGIFVLGLFPRPFLRAMEPSVARLRSQYDIKLRDSIANPEAVRLVGGAVPPRPLPATLETAPPQAPTPSPPAQQPGHEGHAHP